VGDLCLIYVCTDGDNSGLTAWLDTNASGTYNAGEPLWTLLAETSNGTASYSGWLYHRWDGTEDKSKELRITWAESETFYIVFLQITGPTHEFPLIIPAAVTATTANPDPPAVPALKESRDVLYIAATSHDHTDTWSSDPSGYATVQNGNSGTGSGDCGGAVAYRAVTGSAAEDPGTFTNSGSEETVAWTIAVLGDLSPVVAESDAVAVPATAATLGAAAATTAQIFGFTPRESCNIEKIACYMAKVASPTDDVTFSIRTAYNGANAATTAAVDVQAAGWYEGTIASPYAVTAGTTYWVAVERTGAVNGTNYYSIYYNASGNPLQTSYVYGGGSTYTEQATYDFAFQARKTTAVEWVPVDPMGASGFFGV